MGHDFNSFNFKVIDCEGDELILKESDQFFNVFRYLLEEDNENESIGILSIIIDLYGINELLSFTIENKLTIEKKNGYSRFENKTYIYLTVILSEVLNYFIKSSASILENNRELKELIKYLKKLRAEIKHYEYKKNEKINSRVAHDMGRSTNIYEPKLDVVIYFNTECNLFYGTNIQLFREYDLKSSNYFYMFKQTLNVFNEIFKIDIPTSFLRTSSKKDQVKRYSYSYNDISTSNENLSDRELNRLLTSIDDLSSVHEAFTYIIDTGDYLKEKPYFIYFIQKMLMITIDETFDNLKNYLAFNSNGIIAETVNEIIDGYDQEFLEYCREFRNNIHYTKQNKICIGDVHYSYNKLQTTLEIISNLIRELNRLINIDLKKSKLYSYKFLAWAQSESIK